MTGGGNFQHSTTAGGLVRVTAPVSPGLNRPVALRPPGMVWVAAMNGRHAAARPGPSTDRLMAGVVLAQIVILITVISLALAG